MTPEEVTIEVERIRLSPEAKAVFNAACARVTKESLNMYLSPGYIRYMPMAALRDYVQRELVRVKTGMKERLPEKPWHQL